MSLAHPGGPQRHRFQEVGVACFGPNRRLRGGGPLPPEVQKHDAYVALPMRGAANAQAAAALVRFLGTAPAEAALAAGGVEQRAFLNLRRIRKP